MTPFHSHDNSFPNQQILPMVMAINSFPNQWFPYESMFNFNKHRENMVNNLLMESNSESIYFHEIKNGMVMKMCLVEFLKIFLVKIFSQTNQKLETIKSHFQLKPGTSFWIKWKRGGRNIILSKSKNTFHFENAFSVFLFLENRK